jgi:hypothetical protein
MRPPHEIPQIVAELTPAFERPIDLHDERVEAEARIDARAAPGSPQRNQHAERPREFVTLARHSASPIPE